MVRLRYQLKHNQNTLWLAVGAVGFLLLYVLAFVVLLLWLATSGQMGGNSAELIIPKAIIPTPLPVTEALLGRQPNEESLLREGLVRTRQVTEPFVIDADLEGWAEIETTSSAYQVYAADSWDGSADGAAFWRTAWDNDFLYISAIVADDIHIQASESAVYRGDTLEVQIDTSIAAEEISPRTFTMVLSPGDFLTTEPFAACLRGTTSGKMRAIAQHSTQVAVAQTETGYALEAAIPWDDLGVTPSENWTGRIALSLHDTDSEDRIRAEVIQSSITERRASEPDSWGILLLTD